MTILTKEGRRFLTVEEAEKLQRHIEEYIRTEFKLKIKPRFHSAYLEVPFEELRE